MCALLLDLQPGDEVIFPSFAFVTTVNAFVLRGVKPVFADVRPDTLNLDERQLPELVGARTRAIVALHYGGVACEMDSILPLAQEHGIPVVEDNAHGLFATYKGKKLGSFGCLATQSFHETKNITCGEGGALAINDPALVGRAEILREKGTNRSRFFRGQVDKYTWVDLGSSYLPSEILAAFLLAQLEARESIQAARGRILPTVPAHCEQPYHVFYMLLPSLDARTRLIEHLKSRDILAVFHYQPLHLSEMGRRLGGAVGQCPVTEDNSDRLLRLPLFPGLSEADLTAVVEGVQSFEA
jgi:dTDP-4-amino-4,6-dideoxygalactose transaminase